MPSTHSTQNKKSKVVGVAGSGKAWQVQTVIESVPILQLIREHPASQHPLPYMPSTHLKMSYLNLLFKLFKV